MLRGMARAWHTLTCANAQHQASKLTSCISKWVGKCCMLHAHQRSQKMHTGYDGIQGV